MDQTCLVAQIASNLISIGWNAIRCDLPTFLDALETPNLFLPEISETEKTRVSTPSTKQVELSRIEGVDGALDVIQKMTRLSLSEYIVIGEYRRFHPVVRNHLRDWYRRIAEPLIKSTNSRENFLIWAAPGSGKSFFVQEIAASLASRVYYFEQNLALLSKNDFLKALDKIKLTKGPALCLLDEIDARSEEAWPYEECFPLLDMNLSTSKEVVFVLVGSSSTGLQGMVRDMTSRSKGKDLLDRIPVDRRFEIPTLDLEDRVIIFVSQILNTVAERDQIIREIEKLALYYVLKNLEIQTPRQLRELAVSAVGRLPADEYRIKYDDLFYSGDRRNQQFWVDYQEAASRLSNDFVFCGTIIQNFK